MASAIAAQRALDSTPICRCRVLYLGSAVPHVTKDGLQGIQEPLRELYPEQGAIGAKGIDSWLSVWSNGLLLENVDENHKKVSRFFPIDTLHYCAAVRYVLVPEKSSVSSSSSSSQPRFLPLDSPFARSPNPSHPPLFAAILRRTTGIKVLECHTFICKREMAANALVRCCFHAYADSSYARHIDSGGGNSNSVYGTLRDYDRPPALPTSSIEKVEGWNRMGSASGSMLTLNGAGLQSTLDRGNHRGPVASNPDNENSIDDLSIYNGDENHKIWAGSTRDISSTDRDYIYGECGGSTMRSTRSIRPRQVMNAPPPPPPPIKEEKKKFNKDKVKRKKIAGVNRDVPDMYPMVNGSPMRPGTSQGISGMRPHSSLSGTMMKGATIGRMNNMHPKGTILRPASSHLSYRPTPPPMIMMPTTLPHPRRTPVGTFSHHPPKGSIMVPVRPHNMPPNFIPLPPHPMYLQAGRKPPRHYQVAMEEPIYMPSARPLSPVASYQPSHFPHEAYLMQQYATLYNNNTKKKDKHGKKSVPVGMNGDYIQDEEEESGESLFNSGGGYHHKKVKKGKERAQSVNGDIHHHHHHHHQEDEEDDDEEGDGESRFNSARMYRKKSKDMKNGRRKSSPGTNEDQEDDEDGGSPFDTGIYRRKGHLNERAFSYSIRQEHRSRSYGSLANLKFAPPPIVSNGGASPPQDARYYDGSVNKEEMKKEREIMQMMQDLELTGDELERCEVPAGVYRQQVQVMQHPSKLRR